MSIHLIRSALAAIACCAALPACGGSPSDDDARQPAAARETTTTTADPEPADLSVRSTLEGKSVLPQRIKWLAEPTLPASEIESVAFLIDGTVRWIEREAPYGYEEGEGFLVTTWLAPGRHRFTVRVRTVDGRTASRSVRARVRPAPKVPPALAGTWQRHVSQAPVAGAPVGTYRLVFERRWLQDRGPGKWDPETSNETGLGAVIDNYWIPGPKTFVVDGSVTFRPLKESDAEGGWECEPGGPRARYRWSVAGDTLTLAPVGGSDPCDGRGAIFTGKWKRGR